MIDISIIVPAYNAEKYISACLDSLVNQTKKEIEIIAVNDGSTDNTLNILKEYKEKFPKKIKIISQSNQGLSVARNNGIKASSGKYIALIDSDDEVDLELFDKLWNKVNEYPYEIVAFDVELIYPQKTLTVKSGFKTDNKNISTKDSASFFIDMYCMACNKIYKRDLFNDEEMFFVPNTWFEDVLFMHKLIPNLKSLGCINFAGYKYYQRESSITYTYSDKLKDINFVLGKIIEYYKRNNIYETYEPELEYMYVRYMFATYIKRLAKTKNKKKFVEGVYYSLEQVNSNFPNYKKNIYLNRKGFKNVYLKNFNIHLAKIIYHLEKNKMN